MLLIVLSQFVPAKRGSKNGWIAVLACLGVLNVAVHGMNASGIDAINLVLAAVLYKVWTERIEPEDTVKWLLWIGIAQLGLILLQYGHFDPWFPKPKYDGWKLPHGFFPVSPLASIFMAVLIPLAYAKRKLFALPFLLGSLLCGGWAAVLGIGVSLYWAMKRLFIAPMQRLLLIPVGLAIFVSRHIWLPKLGFRITYWQPSFHLWTGNWLTGIGLGNFVRAANDLVPSLVMDGKPAWELLHNEPLTILLELGVIGLLAALGLIRWVLKRRRTFESQSFFIALIVLAIGSLFHSIFHFACFSVASLAILSAYEITTEA